LETFSSLLFFLAAGVHCHDQRFVGRVITIGITCLFTDVLDIIQVLKHLIRRQNLHIQIIINVELEGSDTLQLSLSLVICFDGLHFKFLSFIKSATVGISIFGGCAPDLSFFFGILTCFSNDIVLCSINNIASFCLLLEHGGLGSARVIGSPSPSICVI